MKLSTQQKVFWALATVLVGIFMFNFSFAVTATLFGEINDDGGDPNLEVWFEYGTTTSYGFQTPPQSKYGTGEFTATISDLKECTTYHYRAVAKHKNYDDIKYGEDKTFTTPCPETPEVKVDLKVNGSDGPITVPYNSSATLSWTSNNAQYCQASGDWSGIKGVEGRESTGNLISGPKNYILTCYRNGKSGSDSVTVYVGEVKGEISPSIHKKVRNLSNGQNYFGESINANPGEVLEFQITIHSGSGIKNAKIKDILPNKISIRANSLKIDGQLVSGDITSEISLGDLSENQTKTITFLADIASSSQFPFGETTLINTAVLSWDGNSLSDSATILVQRAKVAAATTAPTGWNNFSSALFPFSLLSLCLLIWLFKSHIIGWEEWLDKQQKEYQKVKSNILLTLKRRKFKNTELFKSK